MLIKQMKEVPKPTEKPKHKKINKNVLKNLCGIVVIILFWYIAVGQVILPSKWPFTAKEESAIQGYDMPCTQAYVAKIMNMTLLDNTLEQTEGSLWYEKYYKAIEEKMGITDLDKSHALDIITYKQLEILLKEVFKGDFKLQINEQVLDEEVSIGEFINIYGEILKQKGKPMILEEREIVILATPADNVGLKAWQLASAGGIYQFEGLVLDPLKGKTVKALVRGNEIISIVGITSEQSVIKLCKIEAVNEDTVTIEANKLHLTYTNGGIKEEDMGKSGCVTLEGERAIAFVAKEEGTTVSAKEGTKESTLKPTGKEMKVRVLLSDQGEYNQSSVELVSQNPYTVFYNDKTYTLEAGKHFKSEELNWIDGKDTVYLKPQEDASELQILTISKSEGHPAYRGNLEIRKEGDYFILVNEVNMEDYVASVIPSEMPTSYGLEALKVQAIAARTYAYASMYGDKFKEYGAQIDDTTSSQVYNNIFSDEMAHKAAELTKGQVLEDKQGNPISSKFFATSCGYTANYGEVWAGDSFPNYTPEYLVAEKQYEGKDVVKSMANEEEAKKFFKMNAKDLKAYDEDSPWFRWQVNLTRNELTALMKPAIKKITSNGSELVKVLVADGSWQTQKVEDIGTIKNLKVMGRGAGGNILALQVEGENATVKVKTEYLIRSLFASNMQQDLKVTRNDGIQSNAMSLLPSAFFAIDETKDGNFIIYGGGFGHGVGMSQDGAKGMAEMGKDYLSIIGHFYPTLEVVMAY